MLSHMAAAAAQRIRGVAWCCAAVLGLLAVPQQDALAQDASRAVCVVAAATETGSVNAMGDFPGGMLIGAEKGLFLARAAGGKVTVAPAGDAGTARVLSIHSLPGSAALIGAWNGVFVAREAGGTISVADVITDTGPVFAMRELADGVLIGAAEGLFLARQANGKLTVARSGETDTGHVSYMFDFPGGGVLIAADKGLFFARAEGDRAESGNVALAPVAMVAPARPDGIMPLRSMRSVAGGGVLIEGYVWFLARDVDGKLTVALAGDANTGVVDAIGDLPGDALLIHTEDKGWFVGRAEGGRLVVAPAGQADTGRVFQMKRVASAMLIWARNGLFVGRVSDGKVTVAPAEAETGQLFQMRDFAGGLLISAERGLFFAREQDGKVTIAPAGTKTGPAHAEGIHHLPGGGTLIATTWKRWFVAREAGGKVTLTPAGAADPGRISLMRDFADGVLIGAERGVFVAGAATGARGCEGP
jgi:ligand-binding sensor domain-containing protein